MAISHEQILELQKYQKMILQLEKIAKESQNDEQRYRVSRDLEKYKTKMKDISPEGIPDNLDMTAEQIKRYKENPNEAGRVLAKYPIMKISPNSNDPEVNQIGTWINVMDREYLPVLNETHVRFDFSHTNEKDGVVKYMENIRRNVKVLTETIEEFHAAEKQEFREQLSRMKNKQTRIFIAEAFEMFQKFNEFLSKVTREAKEVGGVIMNLEDSIRFNPRFERATELEGKSIMDALKEFQEFTSEVLDRINVPNIR
ncbi:MULTISPECIES: hypothetical protein [Leptospira]|uniref:Uncharacterized protein n=5 Tax=Leptospira borgpetersenii TaxID=174 RepID=M3HPA2_LEPBO|nr:MULTISPECIES: hypothetical protein [Leptospira]EMF99895.1 hypothetical protein LEP1GSC123_2831 [Leptospira borgpetersenii str. 200701203]EMO10321.1 hypothetical protein LEP1GSC137_2380 [Leptospira borgpetersenii str. Noumea 25]ALO27247.1 hypothetical protein LBBP_03038 [Leptospira borgpetersenii serovar Ballum]ALO28589.1 hypothetical protein LBBP_04490 [Leptospira borgpetersenii serovar Ballum]ANH01638.1 Uncharacterized protein LB4E_2392 [Leptospira borgpetersenii str. 4E]